MSFFAPITVDCHSNSHSNGHRNDIVVSPFCGMVDNSPIEFTIDDVPQEDRFDAMLLKAVNKTKNISVHQNFETVIYYWSECFQLAPENQKLKVVEILNELIQSN